MQQEVAEDDSALAFAGRISGVRVAFLRCMLPLRQLPAMDDVQEFEEFYE